MIFFVYAIFDLVNRNIIMKKSLSPLWYYLINMGSCVIVVISFAAVQYQIVQGVAFSLLNYIIPFFVGSIFGFLITRVQLLQKKYKAEHYQSNGCIPFIGIFVKRVLFKRNFRNNADIIMIIASTK